MARNRIILAVVAVAALAALGVVIITAADDLNDEEELGSLNHKGESFFREKHLERNQDQDADEDLMNHWERDAREIKRRATRKSKRWTNENEQNRRRTLRQATTKRPRRRRNDVHNKGNLRNSKRNTKGDTRRRQRRFPTKSRRDHPKAGRGRERPEGRRRKNSKTPRKDTQNRRGKFPKNLHKQKSSERRRNNKKLNNAKGRVGKEGMIRKEHRERPRKKKKSAAKKRKTTTGGVKKKKKMRLEERGKSTSIKRKKKVKKMKIILGKGGKKASPKGSCKVSKVVPSEDGNSAVLFGYNIEKKGGCKMTFKGPTGSRLSLDCPQFELNSEGCSQEGIEIYDKKSKEKSEHCKTSGPKGWQSTGNMAVITFLRKASKNNCGRNFVCQISVIGSPQTVRMFGEKEDCGETFDLAKGESAAIFSINGPAKRKCRIKIKAPKGAFLNITCPLLSLGGEYCEESLRLKDKGSGSYLSDSACVGDKSVSLVTKSHMASIDHERDKNKNKKLCSAGFVCVASIIEWWDSVEPDPNYNPKGYKYYRKYLYPNSECPEKDSLVGDLAKCEIQCLEDLDCPKLYYCCPNGCGKVCVQPKETSSAECGCSVTFMSQSEVFYDIEGDYPFIDYYIYDYYDYLDRESILLMTLVWESLRERFTPSVEPYVVNPEFSKTLMGRFETLCQLKEYMERASFHHYVLMQSEYDVFRKKYRKLIIIAEENETLSKVSQLKLRDTYTTVCLITIGDIEVPDGVLSQLTPNALKLAPAPPCYWSLESYSQLRDLAPSIRDIIFDGDCACEGETGPFGPCKEEGEKCTIDDECGQPTHICDKGVCRKLDCFKSNTFQLEPDTDYDFISNFYDSPLDDIYRPGYDKYYHAYDYFSKEYEEIFYDDSFYTDFEASIERNENVIKSEKYEGAANTIINGSEFMPMYNAGGKIKRKTSVSRQLLTNRIPGERWQSVYKVALSSCCEGEYFQCSGIPTMCLYHTRVCDRFPNCPLKDDESEEVCGRCGEGSFKCQSGNCIPMKHSCDGVKDCSDGSDEYCKGQPDCPPYRQHFCTSGECISHYQICDDNVDCKSGEDELSCRCHGFRCKSGECITKDWVCDNYNDCSDGLDEEDCSNDQSPVDSSFKCDNGEFIEPSFVCDGIRHCLDGSDEKNEICSPENCYFCPSGKCIDKEKLCDGYNDCGDANDEANCTDQICAKKKFRCQSGECLDINVFCNGREECVDGSDESACSSIECPDSRPIKCSSGECILLKDVCDGFYDCIDKSDESKCTSLPCLEKSEEKCRSGECISKYNYNRKKCDGYNDCRDGSDELDCFVGCVLEEQKYCDGYRDCPDGSDEENCEGLCFRESHRRCNSGDCVSQRTWCDGVVDCRDGSDELNCEAYSCLKGNFKCNSGECLAKRYKCDGDIDCKDGSDETGCNETCKGENRNIHCKSGECLATYKFCDGYAQCFDGSDEELCSSFTCPFYRPFKCGSGECRRAFHRCDGFVNCADGSDESNCTEFTCPPERPFSCQNGICITNYQICNGHNDCGDGSDEGDCSSFKCPESTFQCQTNQCISYYSVCNDLDDCGDGSDEMNCEAMECPASTFQCKTGKCLPPKLVCNKVQDCPDGDDEENCKENL